MQLTTSKIAFISFVLLFIMSMSASAVDEKNLEDGIYALIETNRGEILIVLEYEKAPLTVINFTGLAEGKMDANRSGKYYDGLKFHRVVDDFMIQGGDPTGSGRGDPGYSFPDEIDYTLKFDGPGILAMANSGPGTNGSQFFITHVETPFLKGKHTIFGRVLEGMNIVNKIKQNDKIESIEIVRVGRKAKSFANDQAAFDRALANLPSAEIRRAEIRKEINRTDAMEVINSMFASARVSESGIHYIIDREGNGSKAPSGTMAKVYYTGTFLDGRTFLSTSLTGKPFEFPVGTDNIIAGWDETIMDMRKGEIRTFLLPPELAFGSRGSDRVPPDTWLIFEVELLDF